MCPLPPSFRPMKTKCSAHHFVVNNVYFEKQFQGLGWFYNKISQFNPHNCIVFLMGLTFFMTSIQSNRK